MSARGPVLITGGSGFIAGWCAIRALQAGWSVRFTLRDRLREARLRQWIAKEADAGDRLGVCTANLLSDLGWEDAVRGCEAVLHVASPYPARTPRHASELIVTAREGTLRVLKTAERAGVTRVIVTSSVAAVCHPAALPEPGRVFTEADWSDPNSESVSAYNRSKTVAERAAWDWVAKHADRIGLTTILPGAVLGPVLNNNPSTSVLLVKMLLDGTLPGCPRLSLPIVDVRDVADLHVRALANPAAIGERFIAAGGESLWAEDVAHILRENAPGVRRIAAKPLPDWVVRAAALLKPDLQIVLSNLSKERLVSNEKARTMLNWSPRDAKAAVIACADSLFANGLVKGAETARAA